MFLPYAHDRAVRRPPWLTIAIVLLNVILFVATRVVLGARTAEAHDRAEARAHQALASAYQDHVQHARGALAGTAGSEVLAWDAFAPALARGPVVGVSDAKREHWLTANADFDRAHRQSPDVALDLFYGEDFRPWQLLTHMFMHAGVLHIVFNLYFFVLCAPPLEFRWGVAMFAGLYLGGGLAAAAAMLPLMAGTNHASLGASGAVAACMGAFFVRHWNSRIKFLWLRGPFFVPEVRWGELALPAWLLLGLWVASQAMYASVQEHLGVAVGAHLGGFGFGAAFALLLRVSDWEKKRFEKQILRGGDASPDDEDTDMALALTRNGAWRDASHFCARALEQHPDHPVLLAIHARGLAHVGDPEAARAALAKAIAKAKASGPTEHLLDAARTLADRVPTLALDSSHTLLLARWFEDDGTPEDALWAYRDVAESNPAHALAPKALLRVAELHRSVFANPEGARAALVLFLERYPEHPLAPSARALLDGLPRARPSSIPLDPS